MCSILGVDVHPSDIKNDHEMRTTTRLRNPPVNKIKQDIIVLLGGEENWQEVFRNENIRHPAASSTDDYNCPHCLDGPDGRHQGRSEMNASKWTAS